MQSRKTGAAFAARRNQFFPAAAEEEEADCREKKEGLIGKSTLYALASAVLVSSPLDIFALQLSYTAHGKYFH